MRTFVFLFTLLAATAFGGLAERIREEIPRVPELAVVREKARELGLRVYLFGGGAASVAHHSRLLPTQDIDLAVDGDPELLKPLLPQGPRWDVKPLSELLSPDFKRQHNDSQSTGLIDVESGNVIDLLSPPRFLEDAEAGVIHYLPSPHHTSTARFRSGANPPILSVVRCLSKAFQFDLAIPAADLAEMRKVVDAFDPDEPLPRYVHRWLEWNGPKVFTQSSDVARSWNTLEAMGLRVKLMEVSERPVPRVRRRFFIKWTERVVNPAREGSLAWWLDKEPLRDASDPRRLPRVKTAGRTARELGITTVTHTAKDGNAYEAIRHSKDGVPNFFLSRPGKLGETATVPSVYTCRGDRGGKSTGFEVRLTVDPEAREGEDFLLHQGDNVLWLTRDKLRLVGEPLPPASVGEAVRFLLDPATAGERGVRETFRRRLESSLATAEGQLAFESAIGIAIADRASHAALLTGLLSTEGAKKSPQWESWIEAILDAGAAPAWEITSYLRATGLSEAPRWKAKYGALTKAFCGDALGKLANGRS